MFSIITLKQLNNTLNIFNKNKIETEETYVNYIKFLVKREKDIFKFSNGKKNFEVKFKNGKVTDFMVETSRPGTVREISLNGKFLDGKALWEITEIIEGIKRFSFEVTFSEISTVDFENIIGFIEN